MPSLLSLTDARRAVLEHPKDVSVLRTLADAEQRAGNPAEAVVWERRTLKRAERMARGAQATASEAAQVTASRWRVLRACLVAEQRRPARSVLEDLGMVDGLCGDSPAWDLRGLGRWQPWRDLLADEVVFHHADPVPTAKVVLAIAVLKALQKAGRRVWVRAPGEVGRLAALVLGAGVVRAEGWSPAARQAPLTVAPLAWACLGPLKALPEWSLLPSSADHQARSSFSSFSSVSAEAGLDWVLLPPAMPGTGGLSHRHWTALDGWSGARSYVGPLFPSGTAEDPLLQAIASSAGVIGQEGPGLLIAAVLGKPVVVLRASAAPLEQRWWWGARRGAVPWFPTLTPVDVSPHDTPEYLLEQVMGVCQRGAPPRRGAEQDKPADEPVILEAKDLRSGWHDWVDDAIARAVPVLGGGQGPYHLRELADGTHNIVLRVAGPGGEHVVRTADWPVSPPTFYQREFANMARASEHGLAPPMLLANERDGLLVLPYLPGPFLRNRDIREAETAALVARHYLALHQLDGFIGGYDVFRRAKDRHRSLQGTGNALYEALGDHHRRMEEVAAVLTAASPPDCACHNDAIPENIARQGDGLVFIDWQISGMGDPHWDLGTFVGQITMTEAQKDPFYAAYFGHADHPARSRCYLHEVYGVYYNLLRAIDDGRRKPDTSGWKRRHARWLAFMDQFETAGLLPHHLKRAQLAEAIVPIPLS